MDREIIDFLLRHLGAVLLLLCSVRLLGWLDQWPSLMEALVAVLLGAPWLLVALARVPVPDSATHRRLLDRLDALVCGAHRCAGIDSPENSIDALIQCVERDCRLVEFDLNLTADDVAVVFHDETVDRLCNASGRIDQMTWKQVRQLDIAAKFPNRDQFGVIRIPTLTQMVEDCLKLGVMMVIDIKCNDRRAISHILALYAKHPRMYEMAMVSTMYPHLIYLLRRADPNVVGCLAWRDHALSYEEPSSTGGAVPAKHHVFPVRMALLAADWLATYLFYHVLPYLCGLSVLLPHKDDVTVQRAAWLRHNCRQPLRVLVWTVNNVAQKTFLADYMHVPYLTDSLKDCPVHMRVASDSATRVE